MKKIICIIGPSAVGKSYYTKLLIKILNLDRPKTITTRKARDDDDNHLYVDQEKFEDMIAGGDLLEWDKYSGNYYGILKNEFQDILRDEKNNGVVMDLTLDGCRQVRELYGDAIAVALIPDDFLWLKTRLKDRGSNDAVEIENRIKISKRELNEIKKMDVPIVYCGYDPKNTSQVIEDISNVIKKQFKD